MSGEARLDKDCRTPVDTCKIAALRLLQRLVRGRREAPPPRVSEGADLAWSLAALTERESLSRDPITIIAGLSAAFGLLATLLASVGLCGVLAFNVTRRTREIGLRLALGALTTDVLWLVLREAFVLLGIGLAVGLPAGLALAHYARGQLFGVSFTDPVSLGLATLGLVVAATLAGLIPARRASRVDPTLALRYE